MRKRRLFRSCVAAVLAAVLMIVAFAEGSRAGTVFGEGTYQVGTIVASPQGQPRPLAAGGSFDLHAVAYVKGARPSSYAVSHFPTPKLANGQPDPYFNTFFPVQFNATAANPRNVVVPDGTIKQIGGYAVPKNPAAGHAYSTVTKVEQGPEGQLIVHDPASTQEVFRTATDPDNGKKSTADALAKVRFDTTPAGGMTVSAAGSFVETTADAPNYDRAAMKLQTAPPNYAASVVRDPILFSGIQEGDKVQGDINLSASDFKIKVDGQGQYGNYLEIGSNIAGSSAGTIGTDSYGSPLLLRLGMYAESDGLLMIHFEVDSSRLDSGALQFFDPATGSAAFLTADQAASYLANKLEGDLNYDSSTSTWTLKQNIDLLTYQLTASDTMDTGAVDVVMGQAAQMAAPEPSTLIMGGIGALIALGSWRRGKPWIA